MPLDKERLKKICRNCEKRFMPWIMYSNISYTQCVDCYRQYSLYNSIPKDYIYKDKDD